MTELDTLPRYSDRHTIDAPPENHAALSTPRSATPEAASSSPPTASMGRQEDRRSDAPRSLSSSGARSFMEELALRSRNRFRSDRRVFRELPDGFAFLLMALQFVGWVALCVWSARNASLEDVLPVLHPILRHCPLAFLVAMGVTFLSSVLFYRCTYGVLHCGSLLVLIFTLYNAVSSLPGSFGGSNIAALFTLLFLALYYIQGIPHMRLSVRFIQSAARICWRSRMQLSVVYVVYTLLLNCYLLAWAAGVVCLQAASLPAKTPIVVAMLLSLMLTCAFLRDLLQIWLSRVVYTSAFVHDSTTSSTRVVTSSVVTRRPSSASHNLDPATLFSSNKNTQDPILLEETQRQVSCESMWWCVGTAARSALSLVLRGFQVHLWLLTLIQAVVKWGPDAAPSCVLDVFHVPTAIYGTSYSKSRRFVSETMVDHGMDRISVDIYFRTFIYYMFSYANAIVALLILHSLLGPDYAFRSNFLAGFGLALFGSPAAATSTSFVVLFVLVGSILVVTSIDSVHMILCWAICETPTTVSVLEPELMHVLVSDYHARLDLKRFSGDRIHFEQPDPVV